MKPSAIKEKLQQLDQELEDEFLGADHENLSYDFFKALASLSVVTLGGVLSLSEGIFGQQLDPWVMFASGGMIVLAGIISLQCQSEIVQWSRGKKPPSNMLRFGHRLAPGLFGGGIGVFLAMLAASYAG